MRRTAGAICCKGFIRQDFNPDAGDSFQAGFVVHLVLGYCGIFTTDEQGAIIFFGELDLVTHVCAGR